MKHLTRDDMRHELEIRGYSERTISIYIRQIQNFADFFNKPPDTLTPKHIHEFQVYLVNEKQVGWNCFNQTVALFKKADPAFCPSGRTQSRHTQGCLTTCTAPFICHTPA